MAIRKVVLLLTFVVSSFAMADDAPQRTLGRRMPDVDMRRAAREPMTARLPFVIHPPTELSLAGAEMEAPARSASSRSTTAHAFSNLPAPAPFANFLATPDDSIPPDTNGAVGPNHTVTVTNGSVRIHDRYGNLLSSASLYTFWNMTVDGGTPLYPFDPRVIYDSRAGRFVMIASSNAFAASSTLLFAVSSSSNPLGSWSRWGIFFDPSRQSWLDYPQIGMNRDAYVITGTVIPVNGNPAWLGNYAIMRQPLYSSGVAEFWTLASESGPSLTPGVTFEDQPYVFLARPWWEANGPGVQLSMVSTVSQPTFSIVGFVPLPGPRGATVLGRQAGTSFTLATGGEGFHNLVFRNGYFWMAHLIGLPADAPTHNAIEWLKIAPDLTIVDRGLIEDPAGNGSYAFPTIAVNRNSDFLIGATLFHPYLYPAVVYMYRGVTDPRSTTRGDFAYKSGEGPYVRQYSRWGDYSSTVVDPVDDNALWTLQEFAATPVNGDGRWGLQWAGVAPPIVTRRPTQDFDYDGRDDLVWRRASDGSNALWTMNGLSVAATSFLPTVSPNWSFRGAGDFDGDGRADLVWRDANSDQTVIWFMSGPSIVHGVTLPPTGGAWQIVAVGDLNNDAHADLVWRNGSTHEMAAWLMNGPLIASSAYLPSVSPADVIETSGDYNGDGRCDLVVRNASTSVTNVWFMNGASRSSIGYVASPSAQWKAKGSADFDGDTRDDLVWRDDASGTTVIWFMSGATISRSGATINPGTAWNIEGVGDFDADRRGDLMWRHADGRNAIWLMQSENVISSAYIASVGDAGFRVVSPR